MMIYPPIQELVTALTENLPQACAHISGSLAYPDINGTVLFYPFWGGTAAAAFLTGLPSSEEACSGKILGFHIHEGAHCSGTAEEPFAQAGKHFNPENCPHPEHAGDLPPLFSNKGAALQVFFTDRFTPEEIVGRTVIVHQNPDDFTSQPSGNAGAMIACGVIASCS